MPQELRRSIEQSISREATMCNRLVWERRVAVLHHTTMPAHAPSHEL
jgi:hypothetical protein